MFHSAKSAELQTRVTTLEAQLATITTERDAALAQVAQMETAHASAITALKDSHAQELKAKDEAVDARVAAQVRDGLAAAGMPESRLPSAASSAAGTGTKEEQIDDLNAQIEASKDPKEKFTLAEKVLDLMATPAR